MERRNFIIKLQFHDNGWTTDEFAYAYSYRFNQTPVFTPCGDHVKNRADTDATYGFENISLLSRRLLPPGTTVTPRCSFDGDGAPLIVLAKALDDVNGVLRYGDYVEIVLYKNGVNVWKMKREDGKVTWIKRLVGVAHTDLFAYLRNRGDDPLTYLNRMAEENIFWEMNVSYDPIHKFRVHPYMVEFFQNKEQQDIVRESGVKVSVGFDGH